MVSIEEAKKRIRDQVPRLGAHSVPIEASLGCVLATDVFSPTDIPPFDQSSMDGFVVRFNGVPSTNAYVVKGEIAAGYAQAIQMKPGEAYRIFTGAPVPDRADAIVIQEEAEVIGGNLHPLQEIRQGACIRKRGAQTKQGDLILRAGTIISPAGVGFMASCGIAEVEVVKKPQITLIVTGNEIVQPGMPLSFGQIYDANSYALESALAQLGVGVVAKISVPDVKNRLIETIASAIKNSDVILITGGISVGKYDFAEEALAQCGVEKIFYKVAQKPGKPLFAGVHKGKTVFALPGNPASVLVCFYEYVVPALRIMMGYPHRVAKPIERKLSMKLTNNENRTAFIRAKQDGVHVTPLEGQDSYMMRSFAAADCFIVMPPAATMRKGQLVIVDPIPVSL